MRPENLVAASDLLERAAEAGVFLSYRQERLHFKLSVEVFPESLKSEIIENKAALIACLRERKLDDESTLSRPRIVARRRETNELRASYAQQRLWFIDQLGSGSPQYNMPAGLRIRGSFNGDIAERALRRIMERHEPLRTVFRNGGEGPLQQIREHFDFELKRVDLRGLRREEQEQRVREAAEADALKAFDLSSDLMLRACFISLGEDEGVLLLNVHHIAADGWSMSILVNEFRELYEAFSKGEGDPLPALAVQYTDYAQWQREWLAGEVLERQMRYWEEQLAELPQVHDLPLDRPRPAVQTFNGAQHRFRLERATLAVLKQVALQEQATLFMVLQGVFALLLARHSNSHEIVLGTPVANRPQRELERLVGFFVNTLVLRTDCRGGRSFRRYLGEVKSLNLNAQANQEVPFEYLVERLKPPRSTSHAPLFQIMISLNTNEAGAAQLPGLELVPLGSEGVAVKFDLTLDVIEDADGLQLGFAYNTDLFEESTIVRLGEHFKNLARAVGANPDEQIESLPLLTERERNHLLYELNETAAEYARDSCLQELFEAQVALRPESVALVYADRQLSYRELNEQANQVARYLREQGVGPDVLVGLCVERSLAMVVGMLGILKAGGAYVPLDPSYPPERLEYMIADSGPALVLTQDLLEHRFALSKVRKLRLDGDSELLSAYPTHNLRREEVGLTSEHLAYVIYTSGSTGKPKGVQIGHRSLVNLLESISKQIGFSREDTLLSVTTISFDIVGLEIYLPLIAGGRLILVSRSIASDGKGLLTELLRSQANVMQATPATWRLLIEAGWIGSERLRIWCGGEALAPDLAQELLSRGAEVLNLYGPTETTIWSALHRVDHTATAKAVPIGRPLANTQIYILDQRLEPTPLGVPGELYIGGDGLARGYLNRAELTADRFVADPFSKQDGLRLYRTGDLARYLSDGTLEFLGRVDHQVKIRGFRIELGEIEAALGEHPIVRDVAVLAREDRPDDKRLVAYVVLNQECAKPADELRRVIKEKLPSVMMPSAFVVIESMPLTPNGKIDRKALPAPDHARPDIEEAFAPPRTPIEEMMAAIWSQILRLEKVGIYDNFFNVGGHSLLATQVVSRVRDTFNVELPLRVFFETPTVAALAAHIARIQVGEVDDATLSAALAELSQLSADEMESLLAAERMPAETRSLS